MPANLKTKGLRGGIQRQRLLFTKANLCEPQNDGTLKNEIPPAPTLQGGLLYTIYTSLACERKGRGGSPGRRRDLAEFATLVRNIVNDHDFCMTLERGP